MISSTNPRFPKGIHDFLKESTISLRNPRFPQGIHDFIKELQIWVDSVIIGTDSAPS